MTRIGSVALCAALALPALSRAEDQPFWTQEGWPDASAAEEQPQPEAPPPAELPPVPRVEGQAQAPVPQGQWVYTQQYGWIWMPYADAYTQVPANGYGEPAAYVYYPSYGWTWLAAPWIWGIGPWPVFGVWGPARFAWYSHGWWRSPARWHYAPGYWGGHGHGRGAWGGHRGWAPAWGGRVGITRPAPLVGSFRGGGFARGSAAQPHAWSGGGRSFGGGSPGHGGGRAVAPRGGGRGGGQGGGHGRGHR